MHFFEKGVMFGFELFVAAFVVFDVRLEKERMC